MLLKNKGGQIFSVNGQIVNILDFVGQRIYITIIRLYFSRARAAIGHMKTNKYGQD